MSVRYYLEIHEGGDRLPVGARGGYATRDEAERVAERYVDDALPYNTVHVLADLSYAAVAGDGGTTLTRYDGEEGGQ